MVIRFPGALPADSVAVVRSALGEAGAGSPSGAGRGGGAPEAERRAARELAPLLVSAIRAHPDFEASLYPAAFSPPAFHRYRASTGAATELARPLTGAGARADACLRVDVCLLLWLSDKSAYDGGDVLVDDGGAVTRWTGDPGDAIAYAAGARRSVQPVSRGELLVCTFDVQSLVAGEIERRILFDFSRALREFDRRPPSARHAETIRRVYSGLVRMWAELPRRRSGP